MASVAVLETLTLLKNAESVEISVAKNEVEVALAKVVFPVAVKVVTEVEARVELPVTEREVKNADTAESMVAKNDVEVAFTLEKLVVVALVEEAFVVK